AEMPGAEQRDVVLPGGAQDLADLRDQAVDVVAHPALAELAEARQVAPDLGGVDLREGRELLRGDRLPALLLGLRQDLEITGQACRDAERQPLGGAVGRRAVLGALRSLRAGEVPDRHASPTVSRRLRISASSTNSSQ